MSTYPTTKWMDLSYDDVLYLLIHLPKLEQPPSHSLGALISALQNHPNFISRPSSPHAESPGTFSSLPNSPVLSPRSPMLSPRSSMDVSPPVSPPAQESFFQVSARGDRQVTKIGDQRALSKKGPRGGGKKKKSKKTSCEL
jgi:hypothetical protein